MRRGAWLPQCPPRSGNRAMMRWEPNARSHTDFAVKLAEERIRINVVAPESDLRSDHRSHATSISLVNCEPTPIPLRRFGSVGEDRGYRRMHPVE